jgi:hypothetical protein
VILAGERHQHFVAVFRAVHDPFLELQIPSNALHEPSPGTVGAYCSVTLKNVP